MQKYGQDEKVKVIGAYKAGNSDRKISKMYGIPKSTVRLSFAFFVFKCGLCLDHDCICLVL